MRLHEAIDMADRMRPNNVALPDKIRCIWRLEREFSEMMRTEVPEWEIDDDDPELLIAPPHDQVYYMYLLPFIDFAQEEMDLYQVDSMAANQILSEVKSMYRRGHRADTATLKGVFI